MDIQTILFAALGGVLPAILWVWFWNHEDSRHPEPFRLLALAFVAGMVTVALVIPMQKMALIALPSNAIVFAWATIEEVTKFAVAWLAVLSSRENNEPIDPIIYMLTVALGFAAAENTLFLLDPIANGQVIDTIVSGNFRFIGATLLHVLASSIIGTALAFSFYLHGVIKHIYTAVGVILAVTLHAAFNFFILNDEGGQLLHIFAFVWIGIIMLLLAFERAKQIKPTY